MIKADLFSQTGHNINKSSTSLCTSEDFRIILFDINYYSMNNILYLIKKEGKKLG